MILDCPVNCPYLQIWLDTGNAWCELGIRVGAPIPGLMERVMPIDQCVDCDWAKWHKKKANGEPNYTSKGECTLPLDLPMCYRDNSRPGRRAWPWKRPITKWTKPGCKYFIPTKKEDNDGDN